MYRMMDGIFLLLGSNFADAHKNIAQAIRFLEEEVGRVLSLSSIYKTAAWGITDQAPFLNQALQIGYSQSPEALLAALQAIETAMGRIRHEKWGTRLIDIDILYYHQEIIDHKNLTIPHPELHNRLFTLIPLCEIAPGFHHPKLQKTNRELLAGCPDTLPVERA